jgi:arylsulfatase A-like enzyme
MQSARRLSFLRILCLAALAALTFAAAPAVLISATAGGPPPVILVSVDTLRADHLSCFGYTRLETPRIDSLAQGGTVFTEISSQAPITLPSHVSLFTSTYPFSSGIRENAQLLPPGAMTLATVLAAQGYKTAAFIGGYFLDRQYGLAQGFQTYDSRFDRRGIKRAVDLKRPASQVIQAAEQWLGQNSGAPFFLFVHLFDLHQPYDAPAAYHARAPASEYDQELAYVDDSLGKFFEFLARSGLDRRALLVLFSDHGESLGDHGENTHGYFIYRSTLHVPLIFHWPLERRI